MPSRRVWRNTVCAAGPRCSPPGSVLSRAHIYGYGRSLRPPQGTSIAPRRRAVLRQTILAQQRQLPEVLQPRDADADEPERAGAVRECAVEQLGRKVGDPAAI